MIYSISIYYHCFQTEEEQMGPRFLSFFFQAEDGIRYYRVIGVQTCALPISMHPASQLNNGDAGCIVLDDQGGKMPEIGRASCRERVEVSVGAVSLKKKK